MAKPTEAVNISAGRWEAEYMYSVIVAVAQMFQWVDEAGRGIPREVNMMIEVVGEDGIDRVLVTTDIAGQQPKG